MSHPFIDAVERICRAVLVALLFMGCVVARADIYMRDEGAGGIILTDQADRGDVLVAADMSPARTEGPGEKASGRTARQGKPAASRERLASLVSSTAAAHGLPEALLTAVIEVESNFNPGAVSPKGATGLMQLMPGTARHLKVVDIRDPAANVDGGARYLKELLERFDNNLILALAAYNAGPALVQRGGAVPFLAETRRYVPRVIQRYHSIEVGNPFR